MSEDLKKLLADATLGPWRFDAKTCEVVYDDDGEEPMIATVDFDGTTEEQAKADGVLIALAPTLAARVIELEAALANVEQRTNTIRAAASRGRTFSSEIFQMTDPIMDVISRARIGGAP